MQRISIVEVLLKYLAVDLALCDDITKDKHISDYQCRHKWPESALWLYMTDISVMHILTTYHNSIDSW